MPHLGTASGTHCIGAGVGAGREQGRAERDDSVLLTQLTGKVAKWKGRCRQLRLEAAAAAAEAVRHQTALQVCAACNAVLLSHSTMVEHAAVSAFLSYVSMLVPSMASQSVVIPVTLMNDISIGNFEQLSAFWTTRAQKLAAGQHQTPQLRATALWTCCFTAKVLLPIHHQGLAISCQLSTYCTLSCHAANL